MKMVPIHLVVPKEVDEWLKSEAGKKYLSKSAVVRRILANHVREQGLKQNAYSTTG